MTDASPLECHDAGGVVRNRGPGITIAKAARDFALPQESSEVWMQRDSVCASEADGGTTSEREAPISDGILEQEFEALWHAALFLS